MKKKNVEFGKKTRVKQRKLYTEEDNWLEELGVSSSQLESVSKKSSTRTLLKKTDDSGKAKELGRVLAMGGRNWYVQPFDSDEIIECMSAGTLSSMYSDSSLLAVGDIVGFQRIEQEKDSLKGLIVQVGERTTRLSRRGIGKQSTEQVIISNADQLLIVMSAADPFYNKRLIDRYLIAAEQGGLKPLLCINKIELMDKAFIKDDLNVYSKSLDIKIIFTSVKRRIGLGPLKKALTGHITVLSGPSGVGKSSLINALTGEKLQKTGSVSTRTLKGRHITSSVRIFPFSDGGGLADTPGLRELGLWDIHPDDAAFYFHDFDPFFHQCKFTSCTHRHEPDCAIKNAVQQGNIDEDRYQSYLNIAESLEE
jgi:ribosome biogenesis GTPase